MRGPNILPTVCKLESLSLVRSSSPPAAVAKAMLTKFRRSFTSTGINNRTQFDIHILLSYYEVNDHLLYVNLHIITNVNKNAKAYISRSMVVPLP